LYGISRPQLKQNTEELLERVGLADRAREPVSRYSGGMKRRLNLAIGLLNAPKILYLDEPTVGIDALSRQVIIDAIQALRAQSTTVIYTSHYMEEVEALCDEVAIINHGRLVARDSTANLLQQGSQQTLLLRFALTPAPSALEALQKWQPQALHAQQYELSLPQASDLEEIMQLCNAQQLRIEEAQFGVSRLARIYLSLLQDEAGVTAARR
jgi:ABC-2 type transport system ATP-binding protein